MGNFNERLRLLRTDKNLSQQKLADKLGISKSSINMYERGEREPGIETLEEIADFFNVDIDYLVGKTECPNKSILFSSRLNALPLIDDESTTLSLYRKLDETDKAEIRGEMKNMLKAPKYGSVVIPIAARGSGVSEVVLSPEQAKEMDRVIAEKYPELLEDD